MEFRYDEMEVLEKVTKSANSLFCVFDSGSVKKVYSSLMVYKKMSKEKKNECIDDCIACGILKENNTIMILDIFVRCISTEKIISLSPYDLL